MHTGKAPSSWIVRFLKGAPTGSRALDIACGSGRHISAARAAGLQVVGVDRDISSASLTFAGDSAVALMEKDLENGSPWPFQPAAFGAVIVANYLWRPLFPKIIETVGSQGVLIYETFAIGNERFGKPSNPDFLLRPGEILEAVSGSLIPIAYEHVQLSGPDRIVQRLCAVQTDHEWLRSPPQF